MTRDVKEEKHEQKGASIPAVFGGGSLQDRKSVV
jgi:hypothetical protein